MGGSDGKDEGNEDNGEEGEGYGREALILPDGHDDAFLSVILVPGHRRSIYGERHAAYWRGGHGLPTTSGGRSIEGRRMDASPQRSGGPPMSGERRALT